MKRRIFALLLAALTVLSVAACTQKDPSPAVTTGREETARPSESGELPPVSMPAEDTAGQTAAAVTERETTPATAPVTAPVTAPAAGTEQPGTDPAPVTAPPAVTTPPAPVTAPPETAAPGTEPVTAPVTSGGNETPEVPLPAPHTPTESEARLLSLINGERAKAGVPALTFSSRYYACAELRAREITKLFEHTRPNGSDCFTAYEACGKKRPARCAENIATCSGYSDYVAQLHTGLMNSAGHRANILDPDLRTVSLCFAQDVSGAYYLAELFQG